MKNESQKEIEIIAKWLRYHEVNVRNVTYAQCVILLSQHNDGAKLVKVLEENYQKIISKL